MRKGTTMGEQDTAGLDPTTATRAAISEEAAIRERAKKATCGPWFVVGPPWNSYDPFIVAGDPDPHVGALVADLAENAAEDDRDTGQKFADAEFIAHAREDVPWLLARVAELEAQRAAALALCDEAERHAGTARFGYLNEDDIRAALTTAAQPVVDGSET